MTTYFPADYSAENQKKYDSNTREFLEACRTIADGPLLSSSGWAEETLEIDDGETMKAYITLLG
jgi:hypothetical protein